MSQHLKPKPKKKRNKYFYVIPAIEPGSIFCLVVPDLIWNLFMRSYYVYILASKKNGTLYAGVTNDLKRRVYEHKNNLVAGFTKKYHINLLVYFEETASIESAIVREKNLKNWRRDWKIKLIEQGNPEWEDLYDDL